jgi:hypothetical protein
MLYQTDSARSRHLDCCYYYQRAVIRDKKTTNSFDIQLKEEARVLCIILLKKMAEWRRTGEGRPLARFRFLRRPRSTPTVVKMTTIRNNPVT